MTSPNTTFVSGAIYTAAEANALPFGFVGSATLATGQAISALADISTMSITFTAVTGRKYLLSCTASFQSDTAAESSIYIADSSNNQVAEILQSLPASKFATSTTQVIVTPSSGSVTYKLRAANSAGTVTIYGADARAGIACRFIATDIGNA